MLRLIRQNRISKWFSGFGQEAISVGVALGLEKDDMIYPTHRNLGVWTTREIPLLPLFCQLMGREGGFTKGRDRSFHFGKLDASIVGMISHLAAMLPVACGSALASVLDRTGDVSAVFCGDGATREGDFHEALNLASVWKLPVIFIVENNGYGLSTPTGEALGSDSIAAAAQSYGMHGEIVDGNNLLSVIIAVRKAASRGREGKGPTLLEMKTFRLRGHEEASGVKYVPKELIKEWEGRDPVDRFVNHLTRGDLLSSSDMQRIDGELQQEVEVAAEEALLSAVVESTPSQEREDVFASHIFHPFDTSNGQSEEKRFVDAVKDSLHFVMSEDSKALIMGQDVAEYGGVFKVTEGFVEEFGKDRVRNTPIIESGIIGAAMGLALKGFRPIVEMQYADFITCGFNQIVNNLATTHYRWGQPINVTIRAPFGGNIGAGPFHSQSSEAWFCHVPGLKVVIPSSPEDAKGLLIEAIKDPNPVLFFEHKYLYRSLRSMVPNGGYNTPLGVAKLSREGSDMTIVSYGLGVHWALELAEEYEKAGAESIEVVDLRTLKPWDRKTVFNSVKKTGRCLVLHEAALTGGFGGEIASSISKELFSHLDAPVFRVGGEDMPIPFSINLEKEIYSAKSRLHSSAKELLSY